MAVYYHNPRNDALPCERMRGCIFAEDFRSLTTIAANYGTDAGAGNTADRGLTTTGAGYLTYEAVSITGNYLSVVVRFSCSALQDGTLAQSGTNTGWWIWLTSGGKVKAGHFKAVGPTDCEVTCSYADGEVHTVTYLIDLDTGEHSLYVDALTVDTETTTETSPITADSVLNIAADMGATKFTGTIYSVRIFDQLLTESEHDLYHADTLTDCVDDPYACYRMNTLCNDTAGNKIWDRTLNKYHLYKADASTSAYFPTLETDVNGNERYFFDKVNDYIALGDLTLPTTYTITAVVSMPQRPYPEWKQLSAAEWTALVTSGSHWGYVHNMIINSGTPTTLELYHLEYQQMYWQWRGRAGHYYNRLNVQNNALISMFCDSDYWVYKNYAECNLHGTGVDVTRNGSDGVEFAGGTSHIVIPHNTAFQSDEGTIALMIDAASIGGAQCFFDKGTNYNRFRYDGANLELDGSNCAYTPATGDVHLAVVFKDGYKPRFFVNGEYLGDGDAVATIDDSDTTEITIGASNLYANQSEDLQQVFLGNKALSDTEVFALYESALAINGATMETGTRTEYREAFTGVAVDVDVDIGGPYQLIDVVLTFNAAPVTSEDIEITTINDNSDVVLEDSYDPSSTSDTVTVFRFDKRFADARSNIAVDYTNTDGRNIVCLVTYQLDESVT